jgi:hypothetical protein
MIKDLFHGGRTRVMGTDEPKSNANHDPEQLLEWVNQSGFPFQTALEALINRSQTEWRWTVTHVEEAWRNGSDERDGFIDLVIENQPQSVALIVEAKRTLDASWVFLVPNKKQMSRRHLKGWLTWSGKSPYFGWHDVTLEPRTPESQFCIVRGQDEKTLSMLERVGGQLISGIEAYAWEDRARVDSTPEQMRLYCGVIVTTATLQICEYDPDEVGLDDGKILEAAFTEVPVIRFRKQLSTRPMPATAPPRLSSFVASRPKEHTVFVVNANHLIDFLGDFDIDNKTLSWLR